MARKTTTEPKPTTYTLTKEQLQVIRDIATDIMNIRRTLEDLEGQDDISTIMFKVGAMYNVAEVAETVIDEFVDSFNEEDCDDCDDNF